MTHEQIAAALVANGYGHRKPLRSIRCTRTIELQPVPDHWGTLYVTTRGDIRVGHTLRDSARVGPQTRRMMLGEP